MKFDEIWMIFEEKEWMKNDVVGYEWINMDQIGQKMMKSDKFSNACGLELFQYLLIRRISIIIIFCMNKSYQN